MGSPVPADLVRVRLVFDLLTGGESEQAVMGFHLHRNHGAGNTVNWATDVQDIADGVNQKWHDHMTHTGFWTAGTVLNRVEAYHLDAATGTTLDKGSSPATGVRAFAGTSIDASLPLEASCAVSLYSYVPGSFVQQGKTRRGRFYLPPFSVSQMAQGSSQSGLYSAASITQLSGDLTAWLNDVQGMHVGPNVGGIGDSMSLVVVSRATNSFHQVERIRIGRVPDSQRRRRKKQVESYVDSVLAHS